ncbi:MAG: hypothetical protein IJZ29_00110 [Clostridia bacterium]|nr:hypothetical protein [Clostridia bacterium]
MQKQEFVELVQNFIVPLFTGSELEGEEESTIRDAEVAQGAGGTILCKPHKNDDYRLIIRREQPFKRFEIQLVRAILEELSNVYKYNIREVAYKKSLQQYALEKAICKSISDKSVDTLLALIYELTIWGSRTYEGERPTFGFIVSPRNINDKTQTPIHFTKMLSRDFSTMLSDGCTGVMFINAKGMLLNYYNLPNISDQNVYAPFDYIKMAKACQKGRVGIALINNGDLLIFSEGELVFAKRRGSWSSFSHDEIIQKISDKTKPEVQEAVYLSALDVSFAHTGACICYLRKDQEKSALKHIDIYDLLSEEMYNAKLEMIKANKGKEQVDEDNMEENENADYPESFSEFLKSDKAVKVCSLIKIISGKKFHELDRKLRADLLAIDGATIVDHDGNILCIGAIVEIEAGSSGGGRLAAARTLGRYGVSMKVSMDSTITGYGYDYKKGKTRTLFFI